MLIGGEARVGNNGAGGWVLRSTDVRRMERAGEVELRGRGGGRGGRGAERCRGETAAEQGIW